MHWAKSIDLGKFKNIKVSGQNSVGIHLFLHKNLQNSWFQRWQHGRFKKRATFTLPIAVWCKVQNSSRWAYFLKLYFFNPRCLETGKDTTDVNPNHPGHIKFAKVKMCFARPKGQIFKMFKMSISYWWTTKLLNFNKASKLRSLRKNHALNQWSFERIFTGYF